MSPVAVRARGLSKEYRIGENDLAYKTLRDSLTNVITAPFRMFRRRGAASSARVETFWALRDVGFEVHAGEVIGIIGRNGAGKSTLLKILSRITEPTEGEADIRGRVSSLLEVGIGFHGELTGRENLYLNGAILGMRRAEIARKFDEIVSFAEVERFIDTPVKHYSSGMYLRLAFAVAAHLEPEILIVDEVLAVGDASFQKKCLAKMEDVGHQGRTVLFVSHNMPAVTRLCQRVVLLDGGHVLRDGPSAQVVSAYLKSGLGTTAERVWEPGIPRRPTGNVAGLLAVRVKTEDGRVSEAMDIRRPVHVEMEYDVWRPGYVLMPHFQFTNDEGVIAFSAHDVDHDWRGRERPIGRYRSTAVIPGNLLAEGTMFVNVGLITVDPVVDQFFAREVVAFQVVDSLDGDSARGDVADHMDGVVRPMLRWNTQYLGALRGEAEREAAGGARRP